MKATQAGIELTSAELRALIAFTSTDERFAWAHFSVHQDKLRATATDGTRAIEAHAEAEEDAVAGEWYITREFLDTCRRTLQKGELCELKVTKVGLKRAVITDTVTGEQRSTITSPKEVSSTQMTIEAVRNSTRVERRLSGSWFAVQAQYLKDVAIVSAACGGKPVTVYPPLDSLSPLCFEASGYEGRWCGVVMPVRVIGPGDEAAEADEEPRLKEPLEEALEEFHELQDELAEKGVSLTFEKGVTLTSKDAARALRLMSQETKGTKVRKGKPKVAKEKKKDG